MSLTVRPITAAEHLAFLQTQRSVSFLQTPAWGRVKTEWRSESLGWYDRDRLVGVGLVLHRPVPRLERFTLAYYDRAQGAEETVESRDVLAIARTSPNAQPMLVMARDFGDGMAYAIVERDPSGRWREKWRSARGHCR